MSTFYGSVVWADRQLRFAIAILQGKIVKSDWKGRLQLALIIKDRLRAEGYHWHAARVDNWIHRCQPKKQDLNFSVHLSQEVTPEREGEPSSC